jgi:hypothetical protein
MWNNERKVKYTKMMKKILFAFAAMIVLAACGNKQVVASAEGDGASHEVAFEVAKNYFFKNDQEIPSSPKIMTAEEFGELFGMATTMGKDGKPTEIDFTKQFVLVIVLPVTNLATEITPDRFEEKGDTLLYFFDAKVGEAQSYSIQPISLIILDKKYADKTVVMVNEQVKDYYAAVERYLAEQIAGYYAKGEYSVPVYQEVAVNADDSTDIRIWGDFWVYNYKQEGDTLKCVSGGSHPGLMHICQTGENFYVSAFEQVEDGSRFLPSAKRIFGEYFEAFQIHHSDSDEHESLRHDVLRAFVRDHGLTATMYQDYGWPAKELK